MNEDCGEGDSSAEKEAVCVTAEEVFILMKKNTRVSRNIRACWFFRHLTSTITFSPPPELHLEGLSQDLTLVSLTSSTLAGPELDSGQKYRVVIQPETTVTFLASRYRMAFTLDLSPSVVTVDVTRGQLVSEEIFHNFCKCLRALVKPFRLPGSQLMFLPKLFVTVIAHTPVICCAANQVLVQGVSVSEENVDRILHYTRDQLHVLEHKLACSFTKLLEQLNAKKTEGSVSTPEMEDDDHQVSQMQKLREEIQYAHELGLVDMLRCGLLALQMLPENSSSGMVVITDGVVGVPEANLMEALLTQLRNSTITCSFLKVGSAHHLQRQLGHVPNFELMQFITTATFGGYFSSCPDVMEDQSGEPNVYHRAMYYWSFQKGLEGFCHRGSQDDPDVVGSPSWIHRRLYTHPVRGSTFGLEVLRKKHSERIVQAGLSDVLCVRLREGYTIREVRFHKGGSEIEVKLVLPWRDSGKVEYCATAAWPIEKNKIPTKVEIYVEGTYDFLHEITCNSSRKINSPYRTAHIKKFLQLLQNIGQTDKLLAHLQSFDSNPANYEVPEYIRSGVPLFMLDPVTPVINSQLSSNESKLSPFASFWKRVFLLDTSVWQKWMHSHRLGLVLEQDLPLPRYLHVPNSSGRFNSLQCRQALASLNQLLRHWATFVLAENHSYIKFLPRSPDKPPTFFCLLRLTSKPPYVILRLAFLGGTPSSKRQDEIQMLKLALAQLKFPQRNTQKSEKKSALKVAADSGGEQERKAPLQREWSEINCCTLLRKPVEKILIRYEQKPEDLTVVDDRLLFTAPRREEGEGGGGGGGEGGVGLLRRPINSKFNTLSHYLVHHRWVWSVQADASVPISPHTIAKVLQTLTKIRLQEGFHFASANSGVCNMVVEVDMMDSKFTPASSRQGELFDDEHQTCVVQYILFPPHSKTSRDSVSEEDMDEMETTEADRESQIVTECWVEPQFGVCINNTPERLYFQNLNCIELSRAFFEVDFECISSLTTFNHLLYLCQHAAKTPTLGTDITQSRTSSPPSTPGRRLAPGKMEEEEKKSAETSMNFVPFHLNLVTLLPRSQQAELLFSTFVVGTGKSSEQEAGVDPKGSNEVLFTLLFERLKGIHDKEYILSAEEAAKYMEQLCKRDRDLNHNPFPFRCKTVPADSAGQRSAQEGDGGGGTTPDSVVKGRAAPTPDRVVSTPVTSTLTPGTPNTPNTSGTTMTPGTNFSSKTSDPSFSVNSSTGSGNGRFTQKESLHGLPMWKCYMKAVSIAHILLTFIPASYDDLLLLNEQDSDNDRDAAAEERKTEEGDSGSGPRMHTDGAGDATAVDADPTTTATTTPGTATATPPGPAFEDTDSCHTGHTSAGGRRGSGALSGIGNMSSTVITVTEPSPCHSPERSVAQSREDDVKEWVNTSCSAAVPPAKGPMVIPIYVYDCHYHSITESLINRWTFSLPPDIHEDMTFPSDSDEGQPLPVTRGRLASFDKEASVVEEKEEVEFPRPGWRSSLDRKSVDSIGEGVGEFRRQCHLITEAYFSCFVTGLYQSLRHNYFVAQHDMDAAISSICQETPPLEVDMTPFLLASCRHMQTLVGQARREIMAAKETDMARKHSVRFMEVVDIQSDDGEDIILPEILQLPRKMMSLLPSLWSDTRCEHSPDLHSLVQDKFLLTVRRFFQPVAAMPDCYFFCPDAQQRASVCDDYDDPEVKGDSTDEKTDDNTDISMREEEEGEGTGMGDFTPRGGGPAEVRDRGDHSAHVSVDSNLDDSLSDMDLNATQDGGEEEVAPLFIHFTCTLKRRTEQHHTSVTELPQCLGELLSTMKDPLLAINFGEFQVTFDINCMTLPPDSDLENSPKRAGFLRSMSNQSQSSSARPSECDEDHDDTLSTVASSDYAIEEPLSHLPQIQRDAVLIFRDEVEWLLRDEVAAALKHMHPISADAVDFVTKHVKNSYCNKYPSCRYERVSLQFVYGPDRSLKPFVEEFERLSQPGYRLTKVKDFYILTVDRAHANNILHAKALQTALVELSHEGGLGPSPKGVDANKLFPAIEERSHSLPSILPSLSPTATAGTEASMAMTQESSSSGGGGGGGSGDENRPRSCSDAKFSKGNVSEEVRLKQTPTAGNKEGEGEVGDASLRKSFSSAELQGPVTSAPATSTASPEVQSVSLSAIKASPSSLFGHRSRHFSAPSGQGTPQSRASTLPQTPSIGSSRGSGTSDAGFDGDVSDENMDDTASISDAGLSHPQLPDFWLIMTIHSDCVELFFHTRVTDQEGSAQRAEQDLVSRTTVSIQDICCKVNKQLLLNELNDTRMCNRLLEPEADEDVCWTDKRTTGFRAMQDAFEGDDEDESEESPNQGYLAATLDLEPGCFACDCVWKKLFFLHPRLKTGSQRQGISRGLLSLRQVLNKWSVGNRKNMFVIKETKLSDNVFYVKLKELTSTSLSDPVDIQADLETSMSEVSLTSLALRAEMRADAETRSEGDTTSLTSAFSRASSRIEDMIELTAHGIAEPTTEIREDMMKLLQNKLDDTVLDVISVMLARNPQCKLRQEDVQFIQAVEEKATETLRLTFPSHAMVYLAALVYYLRQNLLLFLHTPCYHDDSPDFHFHDYVGGMWKPVPSEHVYLYLSPQAGGRKGLACVACSLVDGRDNPVHLLGCPAPSRLAAANLPTVEEFRDMVDTSVMDPTASSAGPGPTALLQFRIWQKGSLDMRQLKDRLTSAVSHALCDIIMEFTLMTAPVCTTPRNLQDVKVLPVTSLPNSPVTVKKEPERKPTLGRKLSDSMRIGLKPVPQSASPFQTLREKAFPVRSRVSSPPPEGISQSFDWSQIQSQPPQQPPAAASSEQVRASVPPSASLSECHNPELADLLSQYDKGDKGSLHAAFASRMQPWLAFCHEKRLASVYRMEMGVKAGHSLEYILKELQSALGPVGVKAPLKIFKVLQYTSMDSAPISVPFYPCRPQPTGVDNQIESAMDSVQSAVGSVQFVVVAREHGLWSLTVAPDSADYQAIRLPTVGDLKAYQNGTKFHPKVGDVSKDKEAPSGVSQIFIPRQKLLAMFVGEKKLVVYMYNYAGDVTVGVDKTVNNIVNWHNARAQVLSSILHQKMGLFQHLPFEKPYSNIMDSNPYMNSASEIDNLIRFSAPPREVTRRHSSITAQSRSISRVLNQYRPFDDTYKNLKPARPMHKTVNGSLADHVARHGMQAQEIRSRYRKDAERMMKLQHIYLNWLTKSANPNSPVSEEYLDLLKQSSRLFHYCATPFLFCQQWRHSLLSQTSSLKTTPAPPPPTPERDAVTTKSPAFPSLLTVPSQTSDRSRHSSGASISSQRMRRSDSQDAGRGKRTTDPSPAPSSSGVSAATTGASGDPQSRRPAGPGPEDSWHQNMCQDFLTQYRNYLVSEFGFVCINVQPNISRRAAQSSRVMEGMQRSSSMTVNLHKTLTSGIILMELSLRDKFFILRMFVFDYLQLGIANHDMQMLFVDECEKYKDLIHVHSFAHDFHLRCINDYLRCNTSMLHPSFHISNFLVDFLKIYPIPPSFARNCLAQESAVIRDLPCPGPQLFDYMRTQSRQFAMDVFRMSPSDVVESDFCFIKQDDFALVQIREPDVPVLEEEGGGQEGAAADVELDGYNVTLIITQDSGRTLTVSESDSDLLRLNFFVVLTRLRDIHPKRTLEKKFGDFRSGPMVVQSLSEGSDSSSAGGGEGEVGVPVAVKQHLGVRQEHTNYLGYSNVHQTRIYTLLTSQITAGRDKIEDMVQMSKVKCRRDYLWQRMTVTVKEEGKKKGKQQDEPLEPTLQPLSAGEFEELLQLVWCQPLTEVDPRLAVFSNMPPAWFSSLLPVLTARFTHHCRFFPSLHPSLHHTVILNNHWQDMFILLSVDSNTGCTALSQVLRNRGEEEERRVGEEPTSTEEEEEEMDEGGRPRSHSLLTEHKFSLIEDFVNVCCFHLWSSIL